MKFKIIVDSSSNLINGYIKDDDVLFESIPLHVMLGEKEYIDDETLDLDSFMVDINNSKNIKTSSSCPAPGAFLNALSGADYYFIVTISKKLSGCYEAANTAISSFGDPSKVFLIDSKAVAGSMILLVDKLYELIKEGKSFEDIKHDIIKYRNRLNLLFVLDSFDNLIKNGRMNKIVAAVATLLKIKPLCVADDGEIKVKEKPISKDGAYKRLVFNIGKLTTDAEDTNKKIIICHTNAEKSALSIKEKIIEHFNYLKIRIVQNRGLCSYYSLQNGIIVSFE